VVGTRLIALVCLVGFPVVVAVTMLERLFPPELSNAVAGPIEELAKLAVPLAMYLLWPRFRAPRTGLALVLASAATLGVYEVAKYAYDMPSDESATMTLGLRPLWDAPLHMALTGIVGAVLWRRWHGRGGVALDLPAAATVVGVMALHSTIDWSGGLDGSLSLLSVALLIPTYLWFKMAARQLVPPDAVASNPPWWRPWRLATSAEERQGSTRTRDPAPTLPGRTTAA
jgi:RsiW-degrading membrane proteinase PrsW (M82 family)